MGSPLLEMLFPARCAGCNAPSGILCAQCLPEARAARRAGAGPFRVRALGPYAGALRSAILAFKRGRRDAGACLALLAATRLFGENNEFDDIEIDEVNPAPVLVPVPTTARRRAERGFDQAAFLAARIGRVRDLGVLCALRQIAGDKQRGRSREERLRAEGRFALAHKAPVAGVRVILIDDVMTTGATLRDCAATLERAGARVIGAVVLAHAESRRLSDGFPA